MRRWRLLLVSVGIGCAALGCVPRKLFWSPDGKQGAVLGTKGLYLCTAQGKLSEMVAPDVALVAWFHDSKRFIAARGERVRTWDAALAVVPEARRPVLSAMAGQLLTEMTAYQGDWKEFSSKIQDVVTPGEFTAMLLYVRDHDDGTLAKKVGDGEEFKSLTATISRLQVYEVADGGAKAGRVIHSSLDGPLDMRISPNGQTLAVTFQVAAEGPFAMGRLVMLPVEGDGAPVLVAERASIYPDWSPDGAYLYFGTTKDLSYGMKASEGQKDQSFTLGTLSRRRVLDLNGGLLSPPSDQEDLVGVLFWNSMKVRCLRDGRILFSSGEVKLPTTTAEMPQNPSLFSIDPARQPTVTRMLPADADERVQGISLGQFELSPDEQRIAVIGSSTKEVAVVTLATGKIETLFPADRTPKELESVPAWRTSTELSLLVPPGAEGGSADKSAVLLYGLDGQGRCISTDWPAIFVDPQAASAPAE